MSKKFKVAFVGLFELLKDKSILIQVFLGIIAIVIALFLKMEISDFYRVLFIVFLVISFEMINTIVERLCDFVNKTYNKDIKHIKDMSSGLVLFSAIFALILGIFIYSKYIWR